MPILSKPPRDIHPAYKEAVVDSLLNGLSARLAGAVISTRLFTEPNPA